MTRVRALIAGRSDPAAGGFYTVQEAARLLGMGNAARIIAWVQGRKGAVVGAVLHRQYQPVASVQELGFWDLLEVRFIEHFRAQGVSLQSLRKAAQTARELWNLEHPFATSKAKYMTDRKSVFQATAEETKDTVLLNLVTRQYAMYVVLEEFLDKGLTFDPATGLAREWRPKLKDSPHVALNPRIAFGQPAIMPAGVPTSTIFKMWKAEDGSYGAAADWYDLDESLVREAVDFELGLLN